MWPLTPRATRCSLSWCQTTLLNSKVSFLESSRLRTCFRSRAWVSVCWGTIMHIVVGVPRLLSFLCLWFCLCMVCCCCDLFMFVSLSVIRHSGAFPSIVFPRHYYGPQSVTHWPKQQLQVAHGCGKRRQLCVVLFVVVFCCGVLLCWAGLGWAGLGCVLTRVSVLCVRVYFPGRASCRASYTGRSTSSIGLNMGLSQNTTYCIQV